MSKRLAKKAVKVRGRKIHYAEFLSPGTFISECSEVKLSAWDVKEAVEKAKGIKERYGATPYGFRFLTRLEAGPVKAGKTRLKVEAKDLRRSGIHFITGEIRTAAQVLAGKGKDEEILRFNVKANKLPAIIVNRNSYLATMEFQKDSVLVDWEGNVLQKGLKGLGRKKVS